MGDLRENSVSLTLFVIFKSFTEALKSVQLIWPLMLPLSLEKAVLSSKENQGKLVCLHCDYQSKFNTHLDSMPAHSETFQFIGKFALGYI